MIGFSRTDTSIVGRWWWTVDRWTLAVLAVIIGVGAILLLAASPAVATRIGIDDSFHFVKRQLFLLLPALAIMLAISMMSPIQVRRLAVFGFIASIGMLLLVLAAGAEIKGARRWINLAGLSLQPSEFAKPCFAVLAAWMFAEQKNGRGFPGNIFAIGLYGVLVALLLAQPDLGQAVVVSAIFFGQFFLAGLPMALVVGMAALGAFGLVGAYFTFSHVASRIDRFLDPASGDSYQVDRAMEAFARGGLWGRGPGEGTVKGSIPDSHADFIFAVAGEEFGLIACLLVVSLFAFVVLRGLARMTQESNLFVLLAGAGLLIQFGLQALINMGSTLHLIPTKGMTLPFVSYGGSSLIALALGMGMLLALTRRRFGGGAI
jgi:cell division protein FtsW